MPGMPETELDARVHLLALGALLDMTMAKLFSMAPDPAQAADDWLRQVDTVGSLMTFPHLEPVLSDHAAQELRNTLAQHVHRAKALATGQPFGPTPS